MDWDRPIVLITMRCARMVAKGPLLKRAMVFFSLTTTGLTTNRVIVCCLEKQHCDISLRCRKLHMLDLKSAIRGYYSLSSARKTLYHFATWYNEGSQHKIIKACEGACRQLLENRKGCVFAGSTEYIPVNVLCFFRMLQKCLAQETTFAMPANLLNAVRSR